jgi:flagellar hook-associated protein 3 FlgL
MSAVEAAASSAVPPTTPAPTAIFVQATGEILFDSATAQKLSDNFENGGSISTTYQKNEWLVGDLNPEHYFRCEKYKDPTFADETGKIVYNSDGNVDTEITYDVGYNQTIQVNTNAAEVFDPAIARDLDDLTTLVNQFTEIENLRAKYKEELNALETTDSGYDAAKKRFDAADKAYTYVRDTVSKRFGDQITRYQNYLNNTNVAVTKNGTRSTRLELIKDRLENQQATFKELQEENEGIDMTEVAVLLTAAETTYDAALMATSKIMQNSLINYI